MLAKTLKALADGVTYCRRPPALIEVAPANQNPNSRLISWAAIKANRASAAAGRSVVWALAGLVTVEVPLLLFSGPLFDMVGPFDMDGQKLPVCWRQLNCVTTWGSTGVPSDRRTTSRKASFAMDPPRGSCRDGHMIHGKP